MRNVGEILIVSSQDSRGERSHTVYRIWIGKLEFMSSRGDWMLSAFSGEKWMIDMVMSLAQVRIVNIKFKR